MTILVFISNSSIFPQLRLSAFLLKMEFHLVIYFYSRIISFQLFVKLVFSFSLTSSPYVLVHFSCFSNLIHQFNTKKNLRFAFYVKTFQNLNSTFRLVLRQLQYMICSFIFYHQLI